MGHWEAGKLVLSEEVLNWRRKLEVKTLLRIIARGKEFQIVGVATAQRRESKYVWVQGTDNLESDKR